MANYILSATFNNILTNLNQFLFFYNFIHLLTYQKNQNLLKNLFKLIA